MNGLGISVEHVDAEYNEMMKNKGKDVDDLV